RSSACSTCWAWRPCTWWCAASGRPAPTDARADEADTVLQRLRNAFATSFATKLLVGGLTLAVVLIGGVSSYLLVNRAAVVLQLLQHVTAAQSASAANELAQAPALQTALAATLTQPATADNTV